MAGVSTVTTLDGSTIGGVITGLTAHTWTADANGLFHTGDLSAEWKANEAIMLAGHGDTLTALQRMEGNAEAVLDNTAAKSLSPTQLQAFREDLQREFDAIDAAMRLNQTTYGIDPAKEFNQYTYLKMEETLQSNETLEELGIQGHGSNNPPALRYHGFTTDFQNRTDNKTFYTGGGPGSGEKAIADFLDDDLLTHAPFPTVLNNGSLVQLNQNGNLEDKLTTAITAANQTSYTRVYVAGDFGTSATVQGPVVWVPNVQEAPGVTPVAAGIDQILQTNYLVFNVPAYASTGADPVTWYDTVGWKAGANPSAWFDTNYYLAQNPDVKASGTDPLLQFETVGWKEGRDPSLLFSDSKYLAANPDVAAAGMDPLLHYEEYGQAEGRMTFLTGGTAAADPLVNTTFYDAQLGATLIPTGAAGAQQAAWSYDTSGWQKGLNPDAMFNTKYYLAHNPDVAAAHMDPLLHYETFGWKEGRDPSAAFSTNKYLAAYTDVKAAGMDPLLHYVEYGQAEGRMAFKV